MRVRQDRADDANAMARLPHVVRYVAGPPYRPRARIIDDW